MPYYDSSGQAYPNEWVKVAAGQTTAQISVSGNSVPGRDYLERVIITAGTTAVGAVTVLDGTVSLLVHNAQVTGFLGSNVTVYEMGVMAMTTQGFNITTGASVSCLAVGRF
jgi:hypothetical protein